MRASLAAIDGAPERPVIRVRPQADEVISEAIAALANVAGVFQRGGALVQVAREPARPTAINRPAGAPRIESLREPRILELLAGAARWAASRSGTQVLPPRWAVAGVAARGDYAGIPSLTGVAETPVLRADGTILARPGYDAATGLLYAPPVPLSLDIPSTPTRDDAARCARELLEVVQDFPFATATDRAAWVASLLTPLCRFAFDGPAPLFLIDGNTRGCGKGLSCDVVGLIATGREMTRLAPPERDEEMEKRITALALAGDSLVLIDNVASAFGWPSLDAALTGRTWNARVLGQSRMTGTLDLAATWYATGNNVILAADVVRRVLRIRLETLDERPEERSAFRHPDLRAYVRAERPRLLSAALTILRAYCLAGRPAQAVTPWGSFEAWSDLVRSAIVWAGIGDPAAGRADYTSQADQEHAILEALVAGLEAMDPTGRGVTVNDVIRRVRGLPEEALPGLLALRWAVEEVGGEEWSARRIGKRLAKLQRRVVAGRCIERMATDAHLGVVRWRAVNVQPQAPAGDDGAGMQGLAGSIEPCLAHVRD